jgi:hypothetical protein
MDGRTPTSRDGDYKFFTVHVRTPSRLADGFAVRPTVRFNKPRPVLAGPEPKIHQLLHPMFMDGINDVFKDPRRACSLISWLLSIKHKNTLLSHNRPSTFNGRTGYTSLAVLSTPHPRGRDGDGRPWTTRPPSLVKLQQQH